MKRKLNFILISLALMLAITACDDSDDVVLPPEDSIDDASEKPKPKARVKEITKGALIKGTNGINFGPDGNLYISCYAGQEIVVMDKQSGDVVNRLGTDIGVFSPDDLAFGPDGSLYWTDTLTGFVARMTPDGAVSKQFVALGVNPITFSDEGRLIVGLCFQGDGLYELKPDFSEPPRPIIVSSPGNEFPLGYLNAFDFGADGMLYGPIFAGGIVVKVDIDRPGPPSTSPYTDGTVTVVSTGFTVPVAAKFNSEGVLHVLDQSGEVFTINTETGEKTVLTTIKPGLDNLAFDSEDNLFISNADFGSIVKILPSGQRRTLSREGMISPMGLAVLPGANNRDALFVADLFRLYHLDGLTGREENVYKGDLLARPNNLITPFSLSADGENIIVSSYYAGAVQVWNPQSGQVIETYPMAVPIDAIRFKNDIAVSDLGLGGVVRASDHSMILPIDNANVFAPSGLATNGETLWVADWGTGIVWQIEFDGNTPLPAVPIAVGLLNPEGLVWDNNGGLLVVETGASQLSRINLATGVVSVIADGLKLSGPAIGIDDFVPTNLFDGVAIGQSGDIYVSGGGKNVIYRISEN